MVRPSIDGVVDSIIIVIVCWFYRFDDGKQRKVAEPFQFLKNYRIGCETQSFSLVKHPVYRGKGGLFEA
jgi:hypothetical protein